MDITVRPATEADMPAIRDIYNYEVLNGWATFDIEPKTLEDRLAWFRSLKPPYCVIVAEDGAEVLGWACLRPFHERAAYRFTAENSVYIHQDHRGLGVGSALLERIVTLAREAGFHSIMAGVSERNPASSALHHRFGFEDIGTEREVGYKFERWLDVTWMQLML